MYVAEGLDTGDILLQHPFDLSPDETGQSLHDRMAEAAPAALAEALDLLESGNAPRIPQEEVAMTHTGKLTREDGILEVEDGVPDAARNGLADKGHRGMTAEDSWGGGQGIVIDWETGVLQGGSDPRKDGHAAGY